MVHGLWTRLTQDLDSTSSMHKKVLLFMLLEFSTFVFTAAGVFGVEMFLLLFPLWTFLPFVFTGAGVFGVEMFLL